MKEWPKLENPPVVAAVFQINFDSSNLTLEDFSKYDNSIKELGFPKRADGIEASLNVDQSRIPLGKSKISATSDAKLIHYSYSSEDNKKRLTFSDSNITYIDESEYEGWTKFTDSVINILSKIDSILEHRTIKRTSIRFLNQFNFDQFDDPTEYFKMVISSTEESLPYPLAKYAFKTTFKVSDVSHAVVNHFLDRVDDRYIYILDLDILNSRSYEYDSSIVRELLEQLREIKNTIFFDNVTDKLIELCN